MYYLSNICFMCFKDLKELQTVDLNNPEDSTVKQIGSILPEIILEKELEIPLHICSTCHAELHSFYTFKKLCLENYYRLKRFTKLLEGSGDNQHTESTASQNCENDIELVQEKKIIVDLTSEASEEQNDPITFIDVEDSIYIKEEIHFEDNEERNVHDQILSYIKEESSSDQKCFTHLNGEDVNQMDQDEAIFGDQSGYEHENRNNLVNNQNLLEKMDYSSDMSNYSTENFDSASYASSNNNVSLSLNEESGMKDEVKSFECKICHKRFSRKDNMKVHTKRHTEGVDYCRCLICDKQLLRSSLTRHMIIHKGIKNFQCSLCDKAFVLRSGLLSHMNSHNDSKDFICAICGREFKKRSSLNEHMKSSIVIQMHLDIQNSKV